MSNGGFLAELTQEAAAQVATRFGFDLLGRFTNRGKATTATTDEKAASPVVDDQKEDELDYHLILNNSRFIPLEKRKILRAAIDRLQPVEDRSRAERIIGKVLTQGRTGFFLERSVPGTRTSTETHSETVTDVRKDGSKRNQAKQTSKTVRDPSPTSRAAYPKGLTPEILVKEFLQDSTEDASAADIMLDGILQETRTQRALEAAKKLAAQAGRFGKYALLLFLAYLAVLLALLIGGVVLFGALATKPSFTVFCCWLAVLGLFAGLSMPLANLFTQPTTKGPAS